MEMLRISKVMIKADDVWCFHIRNGRRGQSPVSESHYQLDHPVSLKARAVVIGQLAGCRLENF